MLEDKKRNGLAPSWISCVMPVMVVQAPPKTNRLKKFLLLGCGQDYPRQACYGIFGFDVVQSDQISGKYGHVMYEGFSAADKAVVAAAAENGLRKPMSLRCINMR